MAVKRELRRALRGAPKSDTLILKVAPIEKNEIRRAAKSLNQSMGSYLLALHRHATGETK